MCAERTATRRRERLTGAETLFRSTKAHVAYRALSDCAGKGSLFVVTIVAARRLSPDAFGVFSVGATLGWILAVAADCGIQLHVARAVARNPAEAAVVLRRWLGVRLWTSAIAIALTATVTVFGNHRGVSAALFLLVAAYTAAGLLEFVYYFFRGMGRSDLESSFTLGHRFAVLVCALASLAWLRSVVALAVALLVPAAAALVFALRCAWRLANTLRRSGDRTEALPDTLWHELAASVLPIGAGIVLSALYFRIDLFLVARWLGPAAAGSYNAVFRLVEALRLFPAAVLAVVLPSLVRAGDGRTVARLAAALTSFGVAVMIAGLLTSGWVVPLLYGEAYSTATGTYRLLLMSFPLFSLNYALTHQLIGWNGQRAYLAICATALVANLSLNAVLIPAHGIDGAAWATFWTEMLLTASCAWKLSTLAPRNPGAVAEAVASA